jgi:PBP1b-binding outer membrane lipoprotein LpoB
MKSKSILLPAFILSGILLVSCTKQSDTDTEKKSKTDTLAEKLEPAIEAAFVNVNPVPAVDSVIAPADFRLKLNEVLMEYIHMKQALFKNDSTDALMQSNQLKRALTNIKGESLKDEQKKEWDAVSEKIEKCCKEVTLNEKLDNQRKAFSKMTDIMTELVKKFGFKSRTVYLMYCADKKAGYWLVDTKDISNPYLGISAKPCVEVKEAWKFE